MSWFSTCNPSVSLEAYATGLGSDAAANPIAFDLSSWPAHDMEDGLDLPTFDLYVKSVIQRGGTFSGILQVAEQQVSVGRGVSFNVLRRSRLAIRKHADQVEFQGPSRVPYAKLKPFIQELLVLHHPYLQRKKVLVGLVGFAWDIKSGMSDMLTVATPALDLEFAEHGNLAQFLKSKPLDQSLSERRMLSHQILIGLSCLHECHIVHGDLKLENILVCSSESGSGVVAKLSDFGHSMFVIEVDSGLKRLQGGTPPWNSPEWRESRLSKDFYKSDMYSIGLLIWAMFSPGEDPFNLEGHNNSANLEILPGESLDQKLLKIVNFKKSDKVHEFAYQTTSTTLESFDRGPRSIARSFLGWRSNEIRNLAQALKIVFENTLRLNPDSRSLQPGTKALEAESSSKTSDGNQAGDLSAAWWGAVYFSPRRTSPKSLQLGILRGPGYTQVPGAPMVARLSVAISRAICRNTHSFTVERRRDAAFFLFRSYFEDYGVEEDDCNMEQAVQWLHEFTKLGIASGTEDLCSAIAEFSKRINRDVPIDFPLESSLRTGFQNTFKSGAYSISVGRERSQAFPDLFNEALLDFKSEGLRRLLPEKHRLTNLANFLPVLVLENSALTAATYLHIAASCGDIHMASLLVEKYDLDLNVREDFDHATPLVTALKFSQADFVLWLLSQGVKTGLQDQGIPVLCFVSNFDVGDLSKIFKALCQAGSSVNDNYYFESLCVTLDMLSFAAWASDLGTIELSENFESPSVIKTTMLTIIEVLAENSSLVTCQNALRWACFLGRVDVIKIIETHLSRILKTPPAKSDWNAGLSQITTLSPFQKLFLPYKPNFIKTAKYILKRLGDDIDQKALYNWVKMALIVGDCESLSLWLEQAGSTWFLRRCQLLEEKGGNSLEKSALEWAAVADRKAMFNILLSKEPLRELEQSEGNFPTLLHTIAQRDLLHGKYFCETRLKIGDQVDTKASTTLSEATAFEIAIRYKNHQIADILLNHGACIDAYSTDRPTPLGELISSHSRDAITGIKFLLEHPRGKPSFVVDREHGRTALQLAAGPDYSYDWQYLKSIEDHEVILDMILEHYNELEHLNAHDRAGFTALHHATYRGCDWSVRKLLKAGADPNVYSCNGIRPLDCANTPMGLSPYLDMASPNFNISSRTSKIQRAAARHQCSTLLKAAGGGDLTDSFTHLGLKRYFLGSFGFINNAKEDDEVYEPWLGEFPLKFVTKRLAKLRNDKSQARIKSTIPTT